MCSNVTLQNVERFAEGNIFLLNLVNIFSDNNSNSMWVREVTMSLFCMHSWSLYCLLLGKSKLFYTAGITSGGNGRVLQGYHTG